MSSFTHLYTDDLAGPLVLTDSGIVCYVSPCCKASVKGADSGAICRACHAPLPDEASRAWLVGDDWEWAAYTERLRAHIPHQADELAARLIATARA